MITRDKVIELIKRAGTEGERQAAIEALRRIDDAIETRHDPIVREQSMHEYTFVRVPYIVIRRSTHKHVEPKLDGTPEEQAAWWNHRDNGEFYT